MKRRKMLALLGASPALVAGAPAYARAGAKALPEAAVSTGGGTVAVLNPAITPGLAKRVPLAPRLDTLEGKTIYLVDTDWGGMGQNGGVLEEMQAWFAEHMPSVKTVIRIKRGNFMADDPALWKEIADSKGDGILLGVAG